MRRAGLLSISPVSHPVAKQYPSSFRRQGWLPGGRRDVETQRLAAVCRTVRPTCAPKGPPQRHWETVLGRKKGSPGSRGWRGDMVMCPPRASWQLALALGHCTCCELGLREGGAPGLALPAGPTVLNCGLGVVFPGSISPSRLWVRGNSSGVVSGGGAEAPTSGQAGRRRRGGGQAGRVAEEDGASLAGSHVIGQTREPPRAPPPPMCICLHLSFLLAVPSAPLTAVCAPGCEGPAKTVPDPAPHAGLVRWWGHMLSLPSESATLTTELSPDPVP